MGWHSDKENMCKEVNLLDMCNNIGIILFIIDTINWHGTEA